MISLENIRTDSVIKGLIPGQTVTVKHAQMFGDQALSVTFVDASGQAQTQLVFRDRESALELVQQSRPLSFTADPYLFRLAAEAHRIRLGYLFDPMIAVNTSAVEPLPHQITAVYETMLNRQPLRFLLADDPGAGKTIMAGLLIKELVIRGDVAKCLIVAPGSLVEQWQDELDEKFNLPFDIMTNDSIDASRSGNWFQEHDFCICRLDKLSRNEDVQEKLKTVDWDLVIVDEAHKMSATYFGGEAKFTKRFKLGRLLSERTRQLLLLTATPHNGKDEDFQMFLSLLDEDRFVGHPKDSARMVDVTDIMRRMVKEKLVTMDGNALFPQRFAYTVSFKLSDDEVDLYTQVTDYVRTQFNRADKIENEGRRGTIGFALTILQRRLASSPEAIYQSLRRRRERLEKRLREEKIMKRGEEVRQAGLTESQTLDAEEIDDIEDAPEQDLEKTQEEVIDLATAALTIAELEAEIQTLRHLESLAQRVCRSGNDAKWKRLSETLQDNPEMFDNSRKRRKLIIFTEQRDTLNYLVERLGILLGNPDAIVCIHGQTPRDRRRQIQESFTNDPSVLILVATDAAGEGINLQRAHLMVNYDLPWNPNRIEQRFGRIHRIGQEEPCHLWNLVAHETREGEVFFHLLEKIANERAALRGAVFDVLGQTFQDVSLKELLIQAIRKGDDPAVKDHWKKTIDHELDPKHIQKLVTERSLASESLDPSRVQGIRELMERAQARKLQPHYIRSFFIAAFEHLRGQLHKREEKRFEIRNVPVEIRQRDRVIGCRAPVLRSYERITFDREAIRIEDKPPAALISPGHPLLDACIDLILEKYRDLLRQGAVLIDPRDQGTEPRILFVLENTITDARKGSGHLPHIVSRQMHFVEIDQAGHTVMAGYAPYLDYQPATQEQLARVQPLLDSPWMKQSWEEKALEFAITRMVPEHLTDVRTRREALIQKTMEQVHQRLTSEIRHWDNRANHIRASEQAGKNRFKLNSEKARQRAELLAERLQKRTNELEKEKQIVAHPPTIPGGALIVPMGFFKQPEVLIVQETPDEYGISNKQAEELAMARVLEEERRRGFQPRDISKENRGYDIESRDPNSGCLRFLEVKGRVAGAETVCVTKNEILTGLNKPESYYLVVVPIDDGKAQEPIYIQRPFTQEPEFAAASVNLKWEKLISLHSEVHK